MAGKGGKDDVRGGCYKKKMKENIKKRRNSEKLNKRRENAIRRLVGGEEGGKYISQWRKKGSSEGRELEKIFQRHVLGRFKKSKEKSIFIGKAAKQRGGFGWGGGGGGCATGGNNLFERQLQR